MNTIRPMHSQRGVALFMGLVMLLVMSLLGISAMQGTTMQERLAGNFRESDIAFQGAEDILRQIEEEIKVIKRTGTVGSLAIENWDASGLYNFDCSGTLIRNHADPTTWTDAPHTFTGRATKYRVIEMTEFGEQGLPCKAPEEISDVGVPTSNYYLILAYTEGPAKRSDSILVSTFYYEL